MHYLLIALLFISANLMAAPATPDIATPEPGQIVITGTVPDEASKAGLLARLREVYGADKVVDQLNIGAVVLPANWNNYVQKLINQNLKLVHHGQLKVDGNVVHIRGEVANEVQRQQIASDMATSLNSSYTVNNGLRLSSTEQATLDKILANRIVEFNSGNAILTPKGQEILNELSVAILKFKDKKLEVIGHTDNTGLRTSNVLLSKARADAVKEYLANKGINPESISTSGNGSDNPVASNDSVEGRARNRRIEFRVVQ